MYQIYFLSIVANVLAGSALAAERMGERFPLRSVLNLDAFQSMSGRLILGLVTFVVGFLKLLSVSPGDVAVVGDLVPAVSGMLMGFTLAFQYYRSRSEGQSSTVATIETLVDKYGAVLGLVGIGSAVLHFVLHQVLFL